MKKFIIILIAGLVGCLDFNLNRNSSKSMYIVINENHCWIVDASLIQINHENFEIDGENNIQIFYGGRIIGYQSNQDLHDLAKRFDFDIEKCKEWNK